MVNNTPIKAFAFSANNPAKNGRISPNIIIPKPQRVINEASGTIKIFAIMVIGEKILKL